jgi:NAD(P)-dependent dehydrogenase (short-subunit alcohol dehydrogenase family)
MKAQKSGSIVAFTSGLASNGWPGAAAYSATKAGIIGLVKSAALELRTFGVRINALSPGLVATPVFLKSATPEELEMYERSLGVSQPIEVVPTLMHLLSDASVTISGNVIERRLIPRA